MGKRANRKTDLPAHVAEEAKALQKLWHARPKDKRVSQRKFGQDFGLGTQGNVWQYLNGWLELDATTAEKFARGLSCTVSDFSPRLAAEIRQLSRRAAPPVSTRVRRFPISDRGMDLAAEWEQLDETLKDAFEVLILLAGAARARGEPYPAVSRLAKLTRATIPVMVSEEPDEREHAADRT